MASQAKHRKISHEDRISNLTDPLLLHILSFLPTKSAVATCVLSKRWQPLGMSLSNIDFDDLSIGNDNDSQKKQSFVNYVDKILMLRDHRMNIERFSLNCSRGYDLIRLNSWICLAVGQNAKEINLSLKFRKLYKLVQPIYMCGGSVEILRLHWNILVDVPEDVRFSRLKVLEFNGVKFSSYESVEKLLLNCPVLEDLVIDGCKWLSGCTLNISGSAMKNLTLFSYAPIREDIRLKILIDTPALKTLRIREYSSEHISIKEDLLSLTTAYINVAQKFEGVVSSSVYGDSVFRLLRKISQVRFLSLSEDTMGALDHASDYNFPTFYKMIELELLYHASSGWNVLPDILESAPNLRSLAFPQGLVDMFSLRQSRISWIPPDFVPECLSSHLETIEIREFRGIDAEVSLVKYLLEHGRALRKISIDCSLLQQNAEILKELLELRTGSRSCKLDLIF